jgi:hypothetical protein
LTISIRFWPILTKSSTVKGCLKRKLSRFFLLTLFVLQLQQHGGIESSFYLSGLLCPLLVGFQQFFVFLPSPPQSSLSVATTTDFPRSQPKPQPLVASSTTNTKPNTSSSSSTQKPNVSTSLSTKSGGGSKGEDEEEEDFDKLMSKLDQVVSEVKVGIEGPQPGQLIPFYLPFRWRRLMFRQ